MSAIDSANPQRAGSLESSYRLSRVSPIRGVLARLALLFFLAHPGSAATFGDTRSFLLSRYPNRDVVPSSLVPSGVRRRVFKADTNMMCCFVTTLPANRRSTSAVRPTAPASYGPAATPVVISARPAINTAVPAPHQAATSRPVSPPRCRPVNVVVGDFVSSLERRRSSSSTSSSTRSSQSAPVSNGPMQIMLGFAAAAPAAAAQAAVGTLGQASDAAMSAAGAPLGLIRGAVSQPPVTAAGDIPASSASGPVLQADFWRRSTAPIVDVYDNVVNFVGSKLAVQSLAKTVMGGRSQNDAASDVLYHQQQQLRRLTADLQQGGSSLRYDLVGFIDLDPFEKSRRYFKRKSHSGGKILL